ncbi:MAG TPA: hypothetical protein VIL23_00420 [Clostridia bacterium]
MMDNKITKERLNNHLEYDWFKYLIFILAAVFLWYFVYSMLDRLKDHERIDIFITVPYSPEKAEEFRLDLLEYFKDLGDATVKDVNFNFNDPNDKSFYAILATSYSVHDIVIAPEEVFRFLAVSGRLISLDYEYDLNAGERRVQGSVLGGFILTQNGAQTYIEPYLNSADFSAYYVFDENQKQKALKEIEDLQVSDDILNKKYGIELNSLGPDIFFTYGSQTKYYIGVIYNNLSKSAGGGNKGVFNAEKQDIKFKQAWDTIYYLKNNATKYSL